MRASLAIIGIFGLIVGLSTWFVVKLQREEIRLSSERIAANEAKTRQAIADAAKAQLELEKYKAPRNLTADQSTQLITDLGGGFI